MCLCHYFVISTNPCSIIALAYGPLDRLVNVVTLSAYNIFRGARILFQLIVHIYISTFKSFNKRFKWLHEITITAPRRLTWIKHSYIPFVQYIIRHPQVMYTDPNYEPILQWIQSGVADGNNSSPSHSHRPCRRHKPRKPYLHKAAKFSSHKTSVKRRNKNGKKGLNLHHNQFPSLGQIDNPSRQSKDRNTRRFNARFNLLQRRPIKQLLVKNQNNILDINQMNVAMYQRHKLPTTDLSTTNATLSRTRTDTTKQPRIHTTQSHPCLAWPQARTRTAISICTYLLLPKADGLPPHLWSKAYDEQANLWISAIMRHVAFTVKDSLPCSLTVTIIVLMICMTSLQSIKQAYCRTSARGHLFTPHKRSCANSRSYSPGSRPLYLCYSGPPTMVETIGQLEYKPAVTSTYYKRLFTWHVKEFDSTLGYPGEGPPAACSTNLNKQAKPHQQQRRAANNQGHTWQLTMNAFTKFVAAKIQISSTSAVFNMASVDHTLQDIDFAQILGQVECVLAAVQSILSPFIDKEIWKPVSEMSDGSYIDICQVTFLFSFCVATWQREF